MPRIPKIHRFKRPGRTPYFQIRIGGKLRHLGIDPVSAHKRGAELIAQHFAGGIAGVPDTVAGMVRAWLAENPSQWNGWILQPFIDFVGSVRLDDVADDVLIRYERVLRKRENAPRTTKHKVNLAMRAFVWAVDRAWLTKPPKKPKLQKPIVNPRDVPPSKLAEVFAELDESKKRRRAAALLRFILFTGARPCEACNLIWEEIDLERQVAVILAHKTAGATGRPRTIYLTPEAVAILKSVGTSEGHVFRSRLGKPYTVSGLRAILHRRGVVITPYQLRHSFAQNALAQVSAEDVAKLLGHTDLRMIQVYAQVRDDRSRRVASNLQSPLPHPPQPKRQTDGASVSQSRSPGKTKRSRQRLASGTDG